MLLYSNGKYYEKVERLESGKCTLDRNSNSLLLGWEKN